MILPKITGRRILITGVNGFIGCHVAAIAVRSEAKVVGIDLKHTTARAEKIRASLGCEKFKIYEVDDLTTQELSNILSEFSADAIIHLAGSTRRENTAEAWVESVKGNVLLTAAVISAVHAKDESSRPVLVMAGSQMEYGLAPMPWTEDQPAMPNNPYGSSKVAAAELIRAAVRSKVLKASVVRFPLVFGPGQSSVMIIPELICKALKGVPFNMTEGLQQRRFLFVADAAVFLLSVADSLCNSEKTPSLINAPASKPFSIIDVVQLLKAFLPKSADLRVGGLPPRPGEVTQAWPDSSLAESMNLISLTPMEESLSLTAAWYTQNQWFFDSIPL
jgi:UDP-glucose 4-epimerase